VNVVGSGIASSASLPAASTYLSSMLNGGYCSYLGITSNPVALSSASSVVDLTLPLSVTSGLVQVLGVFDPKGLFCSKSKVLGSIYPMTSSNDGSAVLFELGRASVTLTSDLQTTVSDTYSALSQADKLTRQVDCENSLKTLLSNFSYSPSSETYYLSTAIGSLSPTFSGDTPTSYSVSPSLPSGLSLNSLTGVLGGTPALVSSQSTYTVTATNAFGSATTTLAIQVLPTPTPTPSIPGSTLSNLCVANGGTGAVLVFNKSQSGNVTPLRNLQGANTGLKGPSGLSIDSVNLEMFVGDSFLPVFSASATGNVVPLRTLTVSPGGTNMLMVDASHSELVVSSSSGISVYSSTASGSVSALRTIAGANTGMSGSPVEVRVDSVNNEIYAANGSGSITVYSRTANGNVVPLRTISGANTQITNANAMGLDITNNEIYVIDPTSKILVFSRTANGNVAPARVISGTATAFSNNTGTLVVDTSTDTFYVADYTNNAIYAYPRTGSGNIAPTQTIQGSNTLLSAPWGIDLCP
jgi:hypothetical protein